MTKKEERERERERGKKRERILRNGIASLVMNDERERERHIETDGRTRERGRGTTRRKSGSVVEGGKSPVTARLATDRY